MKTKLRVICAIVVLSLIMAVPVSADINVETRASKFFSAYGTWLEKTSSTSFEIWFDVNSNNAIMNEIGVSYIEVYRSSDQENWTLMRTYDMVDYPSMIDEYTGSHTGYVTYNYASTGYYYTAYVTMYARNSTGIGERYVYTEILHL